MLYFVCVLIGVLVAYAAIRFIPAVRKALFPVPTVPGPVVNVNVALVKAVKTLHTALFGPIGLNVAALFNDVWNAAGLSEKGVPDIRDGKPR